MPTLFLDTHIWNYLVDTGKYSAERLQQARNRLAEGVEQGDWEVVCSLPVLQEILRVHRDDPEKYEAIKDFIFEVVRHRWLIELKDRYAAELFNGGVLSPTSRYIVRDLRRKIERLAANKKDIIDVGELTYKEGLAFKEGQEDAKTRVFADLGSADGTPPPKIAQAYRQWFKNDRDLKGWVLKVLEGGVTRKLFPESKLTDFELSCTSVPSVWQYVDFRQAKILLNLGEARAIKDSDAVDADIFGCSPYYDVLVTEDQKFKEAINLVIGGRFEVRSFEQLMEMLE